MLAGFTNAASRRSKKSLKETDKTFTLGCFCEKTLFPTDPWARYKLNLTFFLSVSTLLMHPSFCFSYAILLSSAFS